MPIAWWSLVGLFAAALINRAADCWLSPARLQCGLTRHPVRGAAIWFALPAFFMLLSWRNPDTPNLWPVALLGAVLILLAVIDWEQQRVPNVIVLPATGLAFVYAAQSGRLFSAVAGASLAFIVFLVLFDLGRRLFGPGALGMGDVKLAALIGAMTGLRWMPYALLAGVLLAGVVAAALLLTGRARRGDALPFGYYLALAGVAVLWIGL